MEIVRSWWDRLGAVPPLVYDSALAVALSLGALAELHFFGTGGASSPGFGREALVVVLLTLPLAVRRRYPIVCGLLQLAGSALILAQPPYTAIFAILLGLYSLSVYGPSPWLPLGWVVIATVSLAIFLPGVRMAVPPAVQTLLGGLVAWLGGQANRQRRAQARMLEERAERLQAERGLAAQLAVAEERRRIARELHDVVAHSVSLIVVQAGAARMVRGQPPRAVEALRHVESSGRQALEDLRHLVGLLGANPESGLAPQPGLAQLEPLAASVRAAGVPVDLQVSGARRSVPPGLDLTVYRIVQEALTNTLKHAPGASARVNVVFGEDALEVQVLDTGNAAGPVQIPSGGHGLIGMRERVAVYGGRLETGPTPEGGFRVRARLPLQPA